VVPVYNRYPENVALRNGKVDVRNSKIEIIWTPIFELYVVRCGSKRGRQKDGLKKDWSIYADCSKHADYSRLYAGESSI
jgi:hypothetical protein